MKFFLSDTVWEKIELMYRNNRPMTEMLVKELTKDPSKVPIALGVAQRSGININELESQSTAATLIAASQSGVQPVLNSLQVFDVFGPLIACSDGRIIESGLSFHADFGISRERVVFVDTINPQTLSYFDHILKSERVTNSKRRRPY
jgi:hypothetical protein